MKFWAKEFVIFFLKELRAVLFPVILIFLIFVSNYVSIPGLYRYDFLFIAALLAQFLLVYFKLETKDEAKTIFLFHIIGLVLELYKTHPSVGSWSYPEPGYLKIATVPLYSGFMYAAVGSYIAHAWKVLKIRLTDHPSYAASLILCFFIYLNFFTNHYFYDYRNLLLVAILVLYYKTMLHFTVTIKEYKIPIISGFLGMGFFVWIAENIATFYGAWQYPGQIHEWHVVSFQKITSWFLLVIICFIVVAYLKHFKKDNEKRKIKGLFEAWKTKILKLSPDIQVEHVGGSAIPGAETKGDLDICIQVNKEDFEMVSKEIGSNTTIYHPEKWREDFHLFNTHENNIKIDIVLVVKDSLYDIFVKMRNALIDNPDLLKEYNAVKKGLIPNTPEYYQAKKAFFKKVLRDYYDISS